MATEKRLIYTGELKEMLADMEATGGHKYYRQGANCILHEIMPQIIDDCPTVYAVEVVHGRWKPGPYHKLNSEGRLIKYCDFYYCSECGTERPMVQPCNYCPHCGAKMDVHNDGI